MTMFQSRCYQLQLTCLLGLILNLQSGQTYAIGGYIGLFEINQVAYYNYNS